MKLIYAPASPFARKVRVLLHETDQLDDVEIVSAPSTPVNTHPALAAANPLGKIPALVRGDAPALYDSRVITRFLDDRAGSGFYPEARLWETLTLEATADGIMDAGVSMVYELRTRPEDKQFEGWVEAQWGKVSNAVTAVNARWMSHLAGPMDMSHIAMACELSYLDFRHDARNWRMGNDALATWFTTFAERDSMTTTTPE